MSELLRRLLSLYFCPAVGEEGAVDDAGPADDAADDLVVDDEGHDAAGDDDQSGDDAATVRAAELATEREERRKEKERADNYARELVELRAAQQPRQAPVNRDLDAEEEILRDPKATPEQKWTVQANRELRSSRQMAQTAMAQAHDVNDKTAFTALMMSDPLAKRYEKRVEEELEKIRKSGSNAPREAVYTLLLGKDMREGKYKKKSSASADPKPGASAPRGKTPGVRSDVNARGGLSEREKRRARLENVQI